MPAPSTRTGCATLQRRSVKDVVKAIVMLGLLMLIATPVARFAFSIIAFALERDRLYVTITTIVLVLLLVSFAIGAAE